MAHTKCTSCIRPGGAFERLSQLKDASARVVGACGCHKHWRTSRQWQRTFACVALTLILSTWSGCGFGQPTEAPTVERLVMTMSSLEMEFDRSVRIEEIRVRDEEGHLLRRIPTAGKRRKYEVPFDSEPGRVYDVELRFPWGVVRRSVVGPDEELPLRAAIELPLGQETIWLGTSDSARVLVPADGAISLGLLIENRRQIPVRYELQLELSRGLELTCDDRRLVVKADSDGEIAKVTLSGRLDLEYDYLQVIGTLHTRRDEGQLQCTLRQWSDSAEVATTESARIDLQTATPEQLAAIIRAGEIAFPADELGHRQSERPADRVVLADPVWDLVRRLLRPASQMYDFYAPYAYQSVELSNRSDAALNLAIESEVADVRSREALIDFAPPKWKSPRESPTAKHLLRLAAGETTAARIPLYVRPSVRAGRYDRRFRVYLLGATKPSLELDAPLYVQRGNGIVSGVVLASLLAVIGGWVAMAIAGRRMVRGIGTRGLAIVGLVAGVHFIVSYASRLGGDMLWALIGPFAIFIAGVGNEGLTSMLVAVVVALLPRVGALTFSSLAVFVLNAMFTGQLGVADVLFVTVSIVLGEAALALLGITTGGRRMFAATRPSFATVLRFAAAIGIANALTLYAQFCLVQVLHRLFFAGWYIAAVALVTGLLYGAAGAAAGTWLGFQLRRASP